MSAPAQTGRPHEDYFPYFDWLRAALAMTVMLRHDGLIPWDRAGNFAVQIFFALSGWLIGNILLRTRRDGLPRFYFNRAVRIWVPYLIALALLIAASLLRDPVTAKWVEIVLYKASFVYNLFGTSQLLTHVNQMPLKGSGSHFWSVNAEEQFYLVAPLLLVLAAPALGRARLTWLLLSVAALHFDAYPSIVLGVTAAVLATHDPEVFKPLPVRLALAAVALAASAGIALGQGYDRLAPLVAVCVVLLLAVPGRKQSLGALVGGMSYPLYLNHWIGVFVASALTKPFGLRETVVSHVMSTLLNIALAWALYVHIERPMLARRAQWYTPALGLRATWAACLMMAAGLALGFGYLAARS